MGGHVKKSNFYRLDVLLATTDILLGSILFDYKHMVSYFQAYVLVIYLRNQIWTLGVVMI